jgi:hypothetical protein
MILEVANSHWNRILLEMSSVLQILENFPRIYTSRKFITVFTRAFHHSLSYTTAIQPIPRNPISIKNAVFWDVTPCGSHKNLIIRSILILSTYVLVLLMFSHILDFLPMSYVHSCYCHSYYMPNHPLLLDVIFHSCFANSSSYEAHYPVSSPNLPSLHPSSVQIFSSVCVRT